LVWLWHFWWLWLLAGRIMVGKAHANIGEMGSVIRVQVEAAMDIKAAQPEKRLLA